MVNFSMSDDGLEVKEWRLLHKALKGGGGEEEEKEERGAV
jgi:hypothetical protein